MSVTNIASDVEHGLHKKIHEMVNISNAALNEGINDTFNHLFESEKSEYRNNINEEISRLVRRAAVGDESASAEIRQLRERLASADDADRKREALNDRMLSLKLELAAAEDEAQQKKLEAEKIRIEREQKALSERITLTDIRELRAMKEQMDQDGIRYAAMEKKINGEYIIQIDTTSCDAVEAIASSKGIEMGRYKELDVDRNAPGGEDYDPYKYDANIGSAQGVGNEYAQTGFSELYRLNAMFEQASAYALGTHSSALINILSGSADTAPIQQMCHGEVKGWLDRANIKDDFTQNFNSEFEKDRQMALAAEQKEAGMRTEEECEALDRFQGYGGGKIYMGGTDELFQKQMMDAMMRSQKNLIDPRTGKIDMKMINSLTARDLGMTEKQFADFKKNVMANGYTGIKGVSLGSLTRGIMRFASKMEDADNTIIRDYNKLSKSARVIKAFAWDVYEAGLISFQGKRLSRAAQSSRADGRGLNGKITQKTVKTRTPANRISKDAPRSRYFIRKESISAKDAARAVQKSTGREALRRKMKNEWNKSMFGKMYTGFRQGLANSLYGKLLGMLQAAKKKLLAVVLPAAAAAFGLVFTVLAGGVVIVAAISAIGSLFTTEVQNTMAYKLCMVLKDAEEAWIEDNSNVDNLYAERNDMKFYYGLYSYNAYLTRDSVGHGHIAMDENGEPYINPWGFTPMVSGNSYTGVKTIDSWDGGQEWHLRANHRLKDYLVDTGETDADGNPVYEAVTGMESIAYGGHTSNIKDILAMTDVMFAMDLDQDRSMTNSVAGTDWEAFKTDFMQGLKMTGTAISSIWDNDAWDNFENEFGVSYADLKMYAGGLFEVSHQIDVELEVMFLPVDASRIDQNTPEQTVVCPGSAEGGCLCYDGFYYRTGIYNAAMQVIDGLYVVVNDEFGAEHVVFQNGMQDEIVISDESGENIGRLAVSMNAATPGCLPETSSITSMSAQNAFSYAQGRGNDGCACYTYSTVDGDEISSSQTRAYYGAKDTYQAYLTYNSYFVSNASPSGAEYNHMYYKDVSLHTVQVQERDERSGNMITHEEYYVSATPVTETWTWSCAGHEGNYCGGHVRVNLNGLVYSIDENQADLFSDDGGSNPYAALEPKLVDVDYTSASNAAWTGTPEGEYSLNDGLNIRVNNDNEWEIGCPVPHHSQGGPEVFFLFRDIFDCDMAIDYGRGLFPYADYREYGGWNEENMSIAINKYARDWQDLYGFDVEINLGTTALSQSEIDAIVESVKGYYGTLSPARENAIRLALESVGRGQYDQAHHAHGYLLNPMAHGTGSCTTTDCSGFVSYVFNGGRPTVDTEGNVSFNAEMASRNLPGELGGVWTTNDFAAGLSPISSLSGCRPGDALIHMNEGVSESGQEYRSNHALLFIGYTATDVTINGGGLSSIAIPAGSPLTVDCTTIEKNGNIYLRNYEGCGFGNSSYVMNPDGNLYCRPFE